jgi:hypothetical protein
MDIKIAKTMFFFSIIGFFFGQGWVTIMAKKYFYRDMTVLETMSDIIG